MAFTIITAVLAIVVRGAVNPIVVLLVGVGLFNLLLLLVLVARSVRNLKDSDTKSARNQPLLARLVSSHYLMRNARRAVLDPRSFRATLRKAQARRGGMLLLIDADDLADGGEALDRKAKEEAIGTIASAIRMAVRSKDLVGRLEDDRLAVFLQGAKEKMSNVIAHRISQNVHDATAYTVSGRMVHLSVCIGGMPASGDAIEEALASVGKVLAAAQRVGPGTIALTFE